MTEKKPKKAATKFVHDGETVEFKLSTFVKQGGIEMWIGYGHTAIVQPGETVRQVNKRVRRHVEDALNDVVQEVLGE